MDPLQCMIACSMAPGCDSFAFNTNQRRCFLKSGASPKLCPVSFRLYWSLLLYFHFGRCITIIELGVFVLPLLVPAPFPLMMLSYRNQRLCACQLGDMPMPAALGRHTSTVLPLGSLCSQARGLQGILMHLGSLLVQIG